MGVQEVIAVITGGAAAFASIAAGVYHLRKSRVPNHSRQLALAALFREFADLYEPAWEHYLKFGPHPGCTVHSVLGRIANRNDKFVSQCVGELVRSLKEGKTLSDAMSELPDVFDGALVEFMRWGEAHGDIVMASRKIATTIEQRLNRARDTQSA